MTDFEFNKIKAVFPDGNYNRFSAMDAKARRDIAALERQMTALEAKAEDYVSGNVPDEPTN